MLLVANTKKWMTSQIYQNYFEDTLMPTLGQESPVLTIYDDYATRVINKVTTLSQGHKHKHFNVFGSYQSFFATP